MLPVHHLAEGRHLLGMWAISDRIPRGVTVMPGSFSIDLSRFAVKSEKEMKTVIQKITMEAFKRVILRSPVDTGRFRANWGAAIGAATVGTKESFDKTGGATVAAATLTVFDWNCAGSIFLTNSMPYGPKLEYGSSNQAPQGMVRVTVAEIQGFVNGVASGR